MKNKWEKLLGYNPTKEMKEMILASVRDEGISLAEACGRCAMPPMYVEGINEPNPDEYDNDFRPAIYIKMREKNK